MVLDVIVEGCDYSFGCQYSGFHIFRAEIIRGWNEELGDLYKKILHYYSRRDEDFAKANKILDEYDKPYNVGMRLFFYHSDCDGEFTPAESELVLATFKHVNPDKFKKSIYYPWIRQSYYIWIKMLEYSIENNKSVLFG